MRLRRKTKQIESEFAEMIAMVSEKELSEITLQNYISEFLGFPDQNRQKLLENELLSRGIDPAEMIQAAADISEKIMIRRKIYNNPKNNSYESNPKVHSNPGIQPEIETIAQSKDTVICLVKGDSMIGADICEGDLLLCDSRLEAFSGDIIIAELNGKLFVKRLKKSAEKIFLVSENPAYPDYLVEENDNFRINSIVIKKIKK